MMCIHHTVVEKKKKIPSAKLLNIYNVYLDLDSTACKTSEYMMATTNLKCRVGNLIMQFNL